MSTKKCGSPCASGKPCKRTGNCPIHGSSEEDELVKLFSKTRLSPKKKSEISVDDLIVQIEKLEVDEMAELERKLNKVKINNLKKRGEAAKENPLAAAAVRGDIQNVRILVKKSELKQILEAYSLVEKMGAREIVMALRKAME
jgi:hypothetical protein